MARGAAFDKIELSLIRVFHTVITERSVSRAAMSMASPLIALAVTVLVGVLLFTLLGKDPLRGLQMFFVEPVKNAYALSEIAIKATPLALIALGLSICYRSNVWNIGAEGQFLLGACGRTRRPATTWNA